MNLKWRNRFKLPLIAILSGLLAPPAFAHVPLPPKKGDVGRKAVKTHVPDFTLIDQDGRTFRFASTRGRWVVATFIFTSCPDVCPLLSANFAALQRSLRESSREDYVLLSITTDPERDTPEVLKTYAQLFKADLERWRFLTGSPTQLEAAWKAFGVTVRKFPDGQIQHTALTTLIDPDGNRRIDYYTDKWHEKEVLKDILALSSSARR